MAVLRRCFRDRVEAVVEFKKHGWANTAANCHKPLQEHTKEQQSVTGYQTLYFRLATEHVLHWVDKFSPAIQGQIGALSLSVAEEQQRGRVQTMKSL